MDPLPAKDQLPPLCPISARNRIYTKTVSILSVAKVRFGKRNLSSKTLSVAKAQLDISGVGIVSEPASPVMVLATSSPSSGGISGPSSNAKAQSKAPEATT